jgi:hypothetical protein
MFSEDTTRTLLARGSGNLTLHAHFQSIESLQLVTPHQLAIDSHPAGIASL